MTFSCGCYYEIETEEDDITKSLPQVDAVYHTTIFSTALETTLEQTFVNSSHNEAIPECRYVFPLYDGISVVAFTCEVGSRVIRGVVREKVEAKKIFNSAMACGETAGLLEQGPSTDVFITTLGNIPAGEKLRVRIKYVGELKHDLAFDGIRLTLPTFISPRYGAVEHQDVTDSTLAGRMSITVDVNMPNECPIEEVRSPSHPISLTLGRTSMQSNESPNLPQASATLSLGTSALDKNFVLEVRHKDNGKAKAIVENHPTIEGQRALMMTLVSPPGEARGEKPEIIIVADQSGSMKGSRTDLLVAALRVLLKSLPVGIKFNICAFGYDHTFLWKKSHAYDEDSLVEAMQFLNKFDGQYGGTQTLDAVQASIQSRDPDQNLSMILATDGDIWAQQDLFSYLDNQNAINKKSIRVFPLGIGNSVSSGLIEGVARAGRGFASSVGEGEQFHSKIMRILKGAMTPESGTYTLEVQYHDESDEDEYQLVDRVTDSLRVIMVDDSEPDEGLAASAMVIDDTRREGGKPGSAAIEAPKLLQAPQVMPPLYALTRTSVYLLLSPQASRAMPKTVILRNQAPENPFELAIPVEVLPEPGTTIHSLAAKRAILELEEGRGWLSHAKDADGGLLKDVLPAARYNDLVKTEAVRLGLEHGITGKYTSCVAVESNSTSKEGVEPTERKITIAPRPKSPPQSADIFCRTGSIRQRQGWQGFTSTRSSSQGGWQGSLFGNHRTGGGQGCLFGAPNSAPGGNSPPAPRMARFSSTTHKIDRSQLRELAAYNHQLYAPSSAPPVPPTEEPLTKSAPWLSPSEEEDQDMGFSCFDDEDQDETKTQKQKQEEQNLPKTSTSLHPLQDIIALQSFQGYWPRCQPLFDICCCSIPLPPAPREIPQTHEFPTILALAYLQFKHFLEKEVWEMLAEKAETYLEAQGLCEGGGREEEWKRLRDVARDLVTGEMLKG